MSHFYGRLSGKAKTTATRCGTKDSGVETIAAGWGGAIHVQVWCHNGHDNFRVELVPWQGSGGQPILLADGELKSRNH